MLMLCPDHQEALRKKISEKGLDHLVSQGVDDLFWLERLGERDPLFWAYQRIMMTLMLNLGSEILASGEQCPLCFVRKDVGEGMTDEIIEAAVAYEVKMSK